MTELERLIELKRQYEIEAADAFDGTPGDFRRSIQRLQLVQAKIRELRETLN